MSDRAVAVLTGLALLVGSWWMADRNTAEPDGEIVLDVAVAAPAFTVIYSGGDEGERTDWLVQPTGLTTVVRDRLVSCASLPVPAGSTAPAPRWVGTSLPDGSATCALAGRWRLADLVGVADDQLRVSETEGRLHVEYLPSDDSLPPESVLEFHLRVRFPTQVEAAEGAAEVDGTTVDWLGAASLRAGSALTASAARLPLAQQLAPWLVAGLAVLIVGIAMLRPRPSASVPGGGATDDPPARQPVPTPAQAPSSAPVGPASPTDPDPDSAWRPPA